MTSQKQQRRALIVTGEASGDLHGANLIKAAREIDPGLSFFGVGGQGMAEAGCEIVLRDEDLAVMGLVEVLGHLPTLYRAFQRLKKLLHGEQRPDVLVLIDFQEFNQRLAREAKKAGVPVLFYVSPQVWAWRRGRVKKIARLVDRLAVIFPFEPAYYRGQDIEVEYVGHPLLDEVRVSRDRAAFLQQQQLDPAQLVVGLFPGSRKNELKYNLATIIEAAELLRQRFPQVQFLLPVAPSFSTAEIEQALAASSLPVRLVREEIYDTANACDAIVTVSGTVTLQIALVGTPMAIVYKMSPLTYAIGRRLIRLPCIGLANIVAGKEVVREFIQHQATAQNIAEEIGKILGDPDYNQTMRRQLARIRSKMGEAGCSERVARMASELSRAAGAEEGTE